MGAVTITSWKAGTYNRQVADVLASLGLPASEDPEADFAAALELGLLDGDMTEIDDDTGEVSLETDRAQILRNIEAARSRGDRSIEELVDAGEIRRA